MMGAIAKQTFDGIAKPIHSALAKLSTGVLLALAVSSCASVTGTEPNLENFGVRQTIITQGLNRPWGMTWISNGSVLVTERDGQLKHVSWSPSAANSNSSPTIQIISGIPRVFASGQGGLLDIALHPDFASNQLVYFTYSDGNQSANRTKVARAKFDGQTITNWQEIFANADAKADTQHFGSRLAWLPDGTLLVALGDGGNPPVSFNGDVIRKQAQNLSTHFGKVVRINDDGSVPADNPFINQPQAKPEIWSYGHRNIQGLAVDSETGQVWSTEHGARGGDELNMLEAGANYGWPVVSFSKEYVSGRPVASATSKPGMVDPLTEWTPSIAPSGLAVYRGDAVPEWQGNVFVGALKFKQVVRIQPEEPGMLGEVIEFDQRVRDVREGPDGFVYVLTDDKNGQLIRLEPKP